MIAAGKSKLASVPTGGAVMAGGAGASAPAAATGGEAQEEKKEEKKEEEEEESDDDMGFGLFDWTTVKPKIKLLCHFQSFFLV